MFNGDKGYLDKTWQEIYEAVNAGRNVYLSGDDEDSQTLPARKILVDVNAEWPDGDTWPTPFVVRFYDANDPNSFTFGTTSADGYPTM